MEITTTAKTLLEHKGSDVWSIGPEATVLEAIRLMAGRRIGALPVLEAGRLIGIISERDYMTKVMLEGRSSKDTPVRAIMARRFPILRAYSVSEKLWRTRSPLSMLIRLGIAIAVILVQGVLLDASVVATCTP